MINTKRLSADGCGMNFKQDQVDLKNKLKFNEFKRAEYALKKKLGINHKKPLPAWASVNQFIAEQKQKKHENP